MSGETDLIKLYSARILELTTQIPHLGRLDAPQATVKRRSPLCGSTVTVDVELRDGRLSALGQDVKACALGQAAAAVAGGAALGQPLPVVEKARDQLRAMLKGSGQVPDALRRVRGLDRPSTTRTAMPPFFWRSRPSPKPCSKPAPPTPAITADPDRQR